jgi:hypothetical protein
VDVVGCADGDAPCDGDGDGFVPVDPEQEGCGDDCDDDDESVNPGAYEGCGADPTDTDACPGCGDGVDNDCDGRVDTGCFSDDLDDDGEPEGTDCEDCNAGVRPGTDERCEDSLDQDCTGDDAVCSPDDADHDGYVAEAAGGSDCDDADDHVYPGAPDRCGDGVDQDCSTDHACASITDADGDFYGAGAGDCDDTDAAANPGAVEVCDTLGVDEDCDGVVNEVEGAAGLTGGCVLSGEEWSPVTYAIDIDHCGECRFRCFANACNRLGDSCEGGVCYCSDPDGRVTCAGGATSFCCPGEDGGCRDLANDHENCGACGHACQNGEMCVAGTGECPLGHCECPGVTEPCAEGEECCEGGCTEVDTDIHNCGVCDNDCMAGDRPRGDLCAEGPGDVSVCFCGRVGTACSSDEWCTPLTEPEGEDCGCRDLDSDDDNCGGCGDAYACGDNEECVAGECQCEGSERVCYPGETCCLGGGCVDLETDREHCGGCGDSCEPDETCESSECQCGGDVCSDSEFCCHGDCRTGTCCDDDGDCTGDQNPDCDTTTHACSCGSVTCTGDESCCYGACRTGECCADDGDCGGDQNPDCDERNHTCFCVYDHGTAVCASDKHCCYNGCKNSC